MIIVGIPLRLESTRIPKKLLSDICGKSLAERTVAQVLSAFANKKDVQILAAVDSIELKAMLEKSFPALLVEMTSPELPSGTDRIFAGLSQLIDRKPELKDSIRGIINVQGDMPFMGAAGLMQVANYFLARSPERDQKFMLTLSQPWPEDQVYSEKAAVKVLSDRQGKAIYFSRFPIPYSRLNWEESSDKAGELHIGVYGYTLESLTTFCSTAAPTIEKAEGLEQLRALYLGIPIFVLKTEPETGSSYRGVDTNEDILWARDWAKKHEAK